MDIINNRRSVRTFLDKQVESEKVEKLLRAAMQAPTARNCQPWRFLVIEKPETIAKMGQISGIVGGCKLAIFVMINQEEFSDAPLYAVDMGAATQNILLECVELGLGAVWIGLDGRPERTHSYQTLLNIPEKYQLFTLLAIGYPQDQNANYFIDRYDAAKVFYERL